MSEVIVIGGGAAGMMAAGIAAKNGHNVHLYEKNDRLGKKIYITGKGRCNVTNVGDIDNFMDNIPGNPYFMYSSFYNLDSSKTIEFFNALGVETVVERGGRVFPKSQQAKDIVKALEKFIKKQGVKIHLNSNVSDILVDNNNIKGIILENGKELSANSVIIATGGLSYPGTGSTGDGYRFAKKVGHKVTKLYPSLVPLRCEENWCAEIMGLSLKNIAITIKDNKNKKINYNYVKIFQSNIYR